MSNYNTRRSIGGARGTSPGKTQVNYHQARPAASPVYQNQNYNQSYTTQDNYSTPTSNLTSTVSPPTNTAAPEAPISPPPPPSLKMDVLDLKLEDDSGTSIVEEKLKPKFKKPLFKVSRVQRRRRMNARLRRMLTPKNSIMVLNEYVNPVVVINDTMDAHGLFTLTIDVKGKTFSGSGYTKTQAKQNTYETAFRSLMLERMSEVTTVDQKELDRDGDVSMVDPVEGNGEGGGDGDSIIDEGSRTGRPPPPEDDFPWGTLASFALHKLFASWQEQGIRVPSPPPKISMKPLAPMKIPEDAHERHPVQLLNQIHPGIKYVESWIGEPPNIVFTIQCTLDGQTFSGDGTNKKEAKKQCAKKALINMGIKYPA